MKIDRIDIPESVTSLLELKAVQMSKLGNVVLIAGKNGSGKSRLLKLIKDEGQKVNNNATIISLKESIKVFQNKIINSKDQIKISEFELLKNSLNIVQIDNHKSNIRNSEANIKSLQVTIGEWENQIENSKRFKFLPDREDGGFVDFVPKSLSLRDSYTTSSQEVDNLAKNIYHIGTDNISQGTIPAIEMIQKRWVNANTTITDDLNISIQEKDKIDSDYNKLKEYIKLFLNTELKRNKDGHPEIFNKRIGEAQLSDGQTILLQFCMALYAQEVNLESLIIFMDEPENHLHPAALIEVLDKISLHVKKGQIWIATHSINILAHFDPSCIWYIDNGSVSYAGNIPKTVLDGLLGNEDEIEKLSSFLELPSQMASTKFAFESLFYPKVLITGQEDSQVNQILDLIKEKSLSGFKLKVLDFGIGKGRLLSTIYEIERSLNNNAIDWLDFYGFDKFDTYKEICIEAFLNIYGSGENRYFNQSKDLLTKHEDNKFDTIVMCNVFHEIEPKDWINLFTSITSPFKVLKDDGYLLIIEDQFLAIGEKAHSKGFLVYDELEFKKIFKITDSDKYKSTDYRKDGRLKSHHIPKKCISRIDSDSKKESLETLLQNAKDEIKKLREVQNPTFKTGKLHGFWAQQLANASLALEEL